jgi:4-hydroxybenzoate polyprenyltransferase
MNIALQKWARIHAYIALARLDKPIGTWLLLFPCWWGLSLAGLKIITHPWLFFVLFIGAISLRSAGCAFNDYLDRDVDRLVERTKNRPLASGAISPTLGLILAGAFSLPGLWVLTQLPARCLIWAPVGMALLLIYPLAKRFTHWPQAVLGMAFSHGIIFGFSAVQPLEARVFVLYLASIIWVIAFDTIYAIQDREDDQRLAVKSTALLFGDHVRPIVIGFYVVGLALILFTGHIYNASGSFYMIMGITAILTAWQLFSWNSQNKVDCGRKFRANQWFGWLAFLALQAGL